MSDFQLTPQEGTVLKTFHKTLREKRLAYRIHAIILLGTGWSVADVAQAFFVDETTIYHWHEKYQSGGKDELRTLCYKGKGDPSFSVTVHGFPVV